MQFDVQVVEIQQTFDETLITLGFETAYGYVYGHQPAVQNFTIDWQKTTEAEKPLPKIGQTFRMTLNLLP